MADWDLLTPGIGLTSIGIVGVFVSLSGIAKTFLDGMHAVSLLTLLIGLIFLTPGIFKDGFPSSRKAKLGSFITLGILVFIGLVGVCLFKWTDTNNICLHWGTNTCFGNGRCSNSWNI